MPKATIIDGKAIAASLTADITTRASELARRTGVRPGLAVVIVGEDPASQVYVRNKKRTAESCGFHSVQHSLSTDATEDEVLRLIDELNKDPAIHGILVQLPLPPQLDERRITQSVAPDKDVDGFHYRNIGMLNAGHLEEALVPCTPAGCMLMIEQQLGKDLSGRNAVVVGRSNIVGKPIAALLLRANATVTICHSRTKNLPEIARSADILVAAVGRARMVQADWVKPGAVVIDVGINRIQVEVDGETKNRLVGDVDFE
ncbi:MAG: bifunctional methylenetetrahydrofolate dehydrogenase/methenyltetrahydrofolate cyclohydrolase FolD, partial [Gammaproteobacteria bacterium]|nr:bifunctional methylenetetrahydrofolate dehydrogenase/methenyltetrahydrofolate cyclohydrolase FolD [Gammaproteobacteria bacterium]